ncbi:MAG: hypothetical protein CMK56_02775 [Proteobacteria bacterium]|nr:hypothetical protein [Pseudomonadota bacterium]
MELSSLTASFRAGCNVLVIGSNGGIGQATAQLLATQNNIGKVFTCSRHDSSILRGVEKHFYLDLESENSIVEVSEEIKKIIDYLDLVLVATGVLKSGSKISPEKNLESLNMSQLERSFRVNSIGPALLIKHFYPILNSKSKSVFAAISARVGSTTDNRLGGWYGYRASKAALNMFIKTAAVELKRKNSEIICVSLHPGTVDTPLSAPFQSSVIQKQMVSAADAAQNLMQVINQLNSSDSGGFFAWDGKKIPY